MAMTMDIDEVATAASNGLQDLLILVDATGSMSSALASLRVSIPEIIRVSALTSGFARIGVVAYRDYEVKDVIEWSGWYYPNESLALGQDDEKVSLDTMVAFVQGLRAWSGMHCDLAEASKTGLAFCWGKMRAGAKTLLLLYADAPMHTAVPIVPTDGDRLNWTLEQSALAEQGRLDGYSANFIDWVSACNVMRHGGKPVQVISLVVSPFSNAISPHAFLSHRTNGACFSTRWDSHSVLARFSVEVVLTWLGFEDAGIVNSTLWEDSIQLADYSNPWFTDKLDFDSLESELADERSKFFTVGDRCIMPNCELPKAIQLAYMRETNLIKIIKGVALRLNLAQRYKNNPETRAMTVEHLRAIIKSDVQALAQNAVFGSLWRAFCMDRTNPARNALINDFSYQAGELKDEKDREDMKNWLEHSYDFSGEITEMIRSVPDAEQFPCVFLNPTLKFSSSAGDGEEYTEESLTRSSLLEFARSCEASVLKRLGAILTRLTYVHGKDELSQHINAEDQTKVPRIPLALVKAEHGRQFWNVLLHTVLPGTRLEMRPAAVLAALSLRMGLVHLREAAETEVRSYKFWMSIDRPENWTLGCMSLLLDVDADYRARHAAEKKTGDDGLISLADQKLFKTLVDYKMAEFNLDAPLSAMVAWTPDKTPAPIGHTVVCSTCQYPRSITIMGDNGVCGVCQLGVCECKPGEAHSCSRPVNVSDDASASKPAHWVECTMPDCRALYVVYNTSMLRVRPKCHFCRVGGRQIGIKDKGSSAPIVECTTCANRMIFPVKYRGDAFDTKAYKCAACRYDHKTIVEAETTARKLIEECGASWLLRNDKSKIANPFQDKSTFAIISAAGTDGFADQVEVLPNSDARLTVLGKKVHNKDEMLATLSNLITSRGVERANCSLCFGDFKQRDLVLACGRKGCTQKLCNGCHRGWYGLNQRGKIINVAALCCPFCRRAPAGGSITQYGLHTLGDSRVAIENASAWIYAWCIECGTAKPYMERVCAAGAPPEVQAWRCEDCPEQRIENGKVVEVELKVKDCPGCGVTTHKMYGCDHMNCSNCHTHWCWNCGLGVSEGEIYAHMDEMHGGIYGGRDEEDDYEDDDDDEYRDRDDY